jgi:hypothetical protein
MWHMKFLKVFVSSRVTRFGDFLLLFFGQVSQTYVSRCARKTEVFVLWEVTHLYSIAKDSAVGNVCLPRAESFDPWENEYQHALK